MFSVEQMKEIKQLVNDGNYIEVVGDMVIAIKQKYDALLKAGFSEEESLEIIIRQGIAWGTSTGEE